MFMLALTFDQCSFKSVYTYFPQLPQDFFFFLDSIVSFKVNAKMAFLKINKQKTNQE